MITQKHWIVETLPPAEEAFSRRLRANSRITSDSEVVNQPLLPSCEPEGRFCNKVLPTMDMRNYQNNLDQQGNHGDGDKNSDHTPEIQCTCGAGKLKVLISHTSRNPNRSFYKCPKCGYFKWCDELGQTIQSPGKPSQNHGPKSPTNQGGPLMINSPENSPLKSEHPICFCKAGKCTILTMPRGENKGRKYYACFIEKGQGACDHFEWVDNQTKESETENATNLDKNNILISNVATQDPNQNSLPYVKDLFSENDMNTVEFWCNDQNAPDKISTGEVERSKESSPVKRAYQPNDNYAINETSPMKRLNLNDLSPIQVSCKNCGKNGHLVSECTHCPNYTYFKYGNSEQNGGVGCNLSEISPTGGTNAQNASPAGMKKTGKCFKCQKEGHWAIECTSFTGTGLKCFKCGRIGHWRKDCTA